MARPANQSNSSARRNKNDGRNPRGKVSSSDLMDQMKAIETLLADVAADHGTSTAQDGVPWDANKLQEIETALRRQGDLLHSLTGGLEQFEDRLASRLIEVIRDTAISVAPSASDNLSAPAEPPARAADTGEIDEKIPQAASNERVDQSWDAIRQAMMDSAADEIADLDPPPVEEPIVDEVSLPTSDAPSASGPESGGTIEPVHFEIPEPIDVASVSDEHLRDAILARENIMRVMASRLRQRIELAAPLSTEQLRELADELPDEFRDQAKHTLALLDGQLRLTELELSLERARLGRQMSQLEESQAAIRSTARQLGCTVLEDGTLEGTVPTTDTHRSGRRWMRVLGFGR